MKITPQILQAIESAVMSAGNRNRFALKAQIAQHLVARWLDGKARNISDDNWDKIFPLISPYLSMNTLKYFREQQGITQEKVAQAIGISQATYSQWENNDYQPKIDHIIKLASFFRCKPSDLDPRFQTIPSSSSTVLDRLAEEMKAAAVRNAEMRWSRYIADIREITERHFRRFDEQERERVFAEISTHPDRPPAVAVEYMARRIIEQMVPAAAAETKEATE